MTTRSAPAELVAVALGAVVHDDPQRRREPRRPRPASCGRPTAGRSRGAGRGGRAGGRAWWPSCRGPCRRRGSRRGRGGRGTQPRQPAALVGPQLAVEALRLGLLAQPIVGQPGEQLVGPRPAWRSAPVSRARPHRPAEQRDGVDRGEVADVVLESPPGSAQRGRIDADPAPPAVQQGGAGPRGPLQLGVGQRRRALVVGDDELPRRPSPRARTACRGRRRTQGVALPRRLTPARSSRSGPTSSMPRWASSAGACSRNRSASSTSSSIIDGSWAVASSAAVSTHPARMRASAVISASSRATWSGPPATSTATGEASQTSSAVHQRPGSSSSTSSRRTSQSS